MSPAADNASFVFARALLHELAAGGVEHVCVCPGSRSAPLAVAASQTAGLRVWTHVDERSAAFFALGLARASRRPAAIVCTSGTAAANFAPAVAESFFGRVPLVVLTADRPPEARDFGAGQTVFQPGIFGAHLRWFHEAPVPEPDALLLREIRVLAARAVAMAAGRPAGPVHLNLPFRPPLHPEPVHAQALERIAEADPLAWTGRDGAFARFHPARLEPDPAAVDALAAAIRTSERGAVVAGPLDAEPALADALCRLARAAGWPVLADGLSGLRSGDLVKDAPLIAHHDALLRDAPLAEALLPDTVLRLGDTPTSKATRQWLAAAPDTWLVDPDGAWQDPEFAGGEVLRADPALLVSALLPRLEDALPRRDGTWLTRWRRAERAARDAVTACIDAEPGLYEPRSVRILAELAPEGCLLFASSSMPVRDVDGFLPVAAKRIRVVANRGANGIDGIPSSALGAAATAPPCAILLSGDLALLHDLGGLLAANRHEVALAIVVFANDGGGIFSYLPIARYGERVGFEESFRVPHGTRVEDVARLFELDHARAGDAAGLREALAAALRSRRTTLVEVPVDRDASVAHHRRVWRAAAEAARAEVLDRCPA